MAVHVSIRRIKLREEEVVKALFEEAHYSYVVIVLYISFCYQLFYGWVEAVYSQLSPRLRGYAGDGSSRA